MNETAIAIIAALALAIFAQGVAICLIVQHYQGVLQDLLDRLMARDFDEYRTGRMIESKKPLRKFVTTDTQAAAIEKDVETARRVNGAK